MQRHVYITGIGAVTGLGIGIKPLWDGLCASQTAIKPITCFDPSGFPCTVGVEILDFSAKDFVPKSYRKAVKVMVRDTEIAVAAAKLAAEDAGIVTKGLQESDPTRKLTYPAERLGCHIGAGLICSETQELSAAMVTAITPSPSEAELEATSGLTLQRWGSTGPEAGGGMNNLQPLWMLKYLPNMLACHVTIIHGAEGPSNTITCAEASGLLSIGESMRIIERGDADVCFSGGAESKLSLMGITRMTLAERIGPRAPDDTTLTPYDPESPGAIPGEGGALLILEEAASARARGAKIYAQVAGFGASQSVDASGRGLELAIRAALRDAKITPADIDAVVPQACGVPEVDQAELAALRAIFGDRAGVVPVVRVTPFVGDCSAGSASILASVAAMVIKEQQLPPTASPLMNVSDIKVQSTSNRPAHLRTVLVCTSAQGGQNAAVVLKAVA